MSESTDRKTTLRREILAWRRNRLGSEDRRRWSRRIAERLVDHEAWSRAESVLFYAPIDGEVQVQDLVRRALEGGREVCLPRVESRDRLSIHRLNQPEAFLESLREDSTGTGLRRGSYGVLEPIPGENEPVPLESLDLVLVPGVLFDRHGNRIGYGKGFYDRFLSGLPERVLTVGLAYHRQISREELPVESHDRPVDLVVHEEGVYGDGTD